MRRLGATVRVRVGVVGGLIVTALAVLGTASAVGAPDRVAALNAAAAQAATHIETRPLEPRNDDASRAQAAVTASGALADAVGDNEGLAPDLVQMVAWTSDDGRYSVGIRLTDNIVIDGDFIATYVNTDGNAATGDPTFGGADLLVSVLGRTGDDVVAGSVWNGAGFQQTSLPSLIAIPVGTTDIAWSVAAAEIGVAQGRPTSLVFGTLYSGIYDTYFDFAPEPGGAPLSFVAGALSVAVAAPLPVAPSAGAAPPPTGGVAGVNPDAPDPIVVRAFRVSRTPKGVRIRLAWTRGDGEVYWSVVLRARVNGRLKTKEVYGLGASGNRSLLRTVRLPDTWRGRRVTASLQIDDDNRTVRRTGSIRF